MHSDVVYSLLNLKSCVDYLYLHHAVFRNPASIHRSRRHALGAYHPDEVAVEESETPNKLAQMNFLLSIKTLLGAELTPLQAKLNSWGGDVDTPKTFPQVAISKSWNWSFTLLNVHKKNLK